MTSTALTKVAGSNLRQNLVDECHALVERTKQVAKSLKANTVELALLLYALEQKQAHQVLGFATWGDLLGDIDIGLSERSSRRYRRIIEQLHINHKIPIDVMKKAELTKLEQMCDIVRNREEGEEWIAKAAELKGRDWSIELDEEKFARREIALQGSDGEELLDKENQEEDPEEDFQDNGSDAGDGKAAAGKAKAAGKAEIKTKTMFIDAQTIRLSGKKLLRITAHAPGERIREWIVDDIAVTLDDFPVKVERGKTVITASKEIQRELAKDDPAA